MNEKQIKKYNAEDKMIMVIEWLIVAGLLLLGAKCMGLKIEWIWAFSPFILILALILTVPPILYLIYRDKP